jgi:hypothetical protein
MLHLVPISDRPAETPESPPQQSPNGRLTRPIRRSHTLHRLCLPHPPVQQEGMVLHYARRQIAVRFLGMRDRKPMPTLNEITMLGTEGILWIVTFIFEAPRQ